MSKTKWLGGMSFFIGVGIQFVPVPDAWRWGITIVAGIGVIACLIGAFMAKGDPVMEESGDSSVQRVSARDAADVVTAADHSTASKVSTGSGQINAPVAGRDIIYHAQPQREQEMPHIFARLHIDNLDEPNCIRVHFQLINGDSKVENIRLAFTSIRCVYGEYQTISGEMAPRDEIDTFYVYLARTPDDNDLVQLTIYFNAKVGAEVKDFIAEHSFPISKDKLVPGTVIKPATNKYREGKAPADAAQSLSREIMRTLSLDMGSIETILPESTPSGEPNMMLFRIAKKLFLFDGARRRVNFQMLTAKGRHVNIALPFKQTTDGYHTIRFGFRPTGGRLGVDGEEVQDYEPEGQH